MQEVDGVGFSDGLGQVIGEDCGEEVPGADAGFDVELEWVADFLGEQLVIGVHRGILQTWSLIGLRLQAVQEMKQIAEYAIAGLFELVGSIGSIRWRRFQAGVDVIRER